MRRGSTPCRRDAGFSLVEVLVAVLVTGIVVASLAGLTTAIFRQHAGTNSRFDLARAEQTLGMWLPTDLASADSVDDLPGATPCGNACPTPEASQGSNAVMLSWTISGRTTNVSYRYVAVGQQFVIVRVQCDRVGSGPWSCAQRTALNDAPPPPSGVAFVPGVTKPDWAMHVTEPPVAGDGSTDPALDSGVAKGARRAMVTVRNTSGPTAQSTTYSPIAITAGSTVRSGLSPGSVDGAPGFVEVRPRCGGTFAVAFDMSLSILGAAQTVREGVKQLVAAFAGTPMRLQVVRFNNGGMTLGVSGSYWFSETWQPYWFDMLDPQDVDSLLGLLTPTGSPVDGGTNWEDALFRLFRNQDGSEQTVLPDTLLFFTDGVPNYDRLTSLEIAPSTYLRTNSANANVPNWADPKLDMDAAISFMQAGQDAVLFPPAKNPYLPTDVPNVPDTRPTDYVQEAWDRANYIAAQYRGSTTRFVGVGVGENFVTVNGGVPTYPPSGWIDIVGGQRVTTMKQNREILARLITGTDNWVEAEANGNGDYVNADVADMFTLPDWTMFGKALKTIALAECGGTLTLQTVLNGQPVSDQFQYQITNVVDSDGNVVPKPTVVTTSGQFPSGTFEFSIPSGKDLTVTLQPINLPSVSMYLPGAAGWQCSAGRQPLTVTTAPIDGTSWTSVTLKVRADQAVSCRLDVVQKPPA